MSTVQSRDEQEPAAGEQALPRAWPFIVAVGASAGGLEALRTLFGGMPADAGLTFVVAVHRSAGQERRLVDLLQPYTALLIEQIDGSAPLEPNRILVIPPTASLRTIDTHVRLGALAKGRQPPRIDELFRAVAASHGSRSIGVVLTGAGSDGALGLRQIKAAGGLVIAQEPGEAEYESMPRTALDAGIVDLVLPLREMAQAIMSYCTAEPLLPELPVAAAAAAAESPLLNKLLELIEARTGRDLSVYQPALTLRGVSKRMRLRGIESPQAYVRLLETDAGEIGVLAGDLLLDGAEFFREQRTVAQLEQDVLPRLFDAKAGALDTLRAWCVGCGTGEEAYSLAIELIEECSRRDVKPSVKLFATDVAEEQLQRARRGSYLAEIESTVSLRRLAEFFVPDEGGHRVRPEVRNLVVFARHDVCKDFPFSHLDLIVCRPSLLADLEPVERWAVLQSFHYALEPHGLLVVGPNEAVEAPELFEPEKQRGQVYRRVEGSVRPLVFAAARSSRKSGSHDDGARAGPRRAPVDARALHLGVLERYMPASVLVDDRNRVIHYSAQASRYVRWPAGELTHDALQILPEPLRGAAQSGLHAVTRTRKRWTSGALTVDTSEGARRVAVHVDPVDEESAAIDAKLLVFEELERPSDHGHLRTSGGFSVLEAELGEASRRLRAVVGEQPDGRSDHGTLLEILAGMEAAKRELKTVNDELSTLNRENVARLEDLAQVSTDLEVLLESTGLATLFLDGELKIIRFTPPLLEIFDVSPADQGRLLADVPHRLRDQDLVADAKRVLKHLAPVDREIESESGKWYLVRMLPYRAPPLGTGVAITLIDVTTRKKAEQHLREADRRKDEFIALLAHELRNPLAPISSGIEILKRRDVEPAVMERVTATMARQAAQLVRLIDDLLDVSRISSGRLRLKKSPVAVADIVRDAVGAVRPLLEREGHELLVTVPDEPIVLEADSARLTQVLANLLNNAVRYTPRGGKIMLAVRLELDAVLVTVTDNGYGIPPNALPHLFEMFYQASDARSSTQGGLGIGLALAKSLVEMHEGTIQAESAGVDRGSKFTLRLPVRIAAHADESAVTSSSGTSLGGHTVLVVDDNADAANTLAALIRALGENEVHVALSGADALPLAQRVKPDTVFLDLRMPEMDGFEVAQRLRREAWASSATIVALTGWGLEEHKRRTQEAGFDQHLTKPADLAALQSILGRNNGARALVAPEAGRVN
jgi:two-component system CheB/CheR fusion protein